MHFCNRYSFHKCVVHRYYFPNLASASTTFVKLDPKKNPADICQCPMIANCGQDECASEQDCIEKALEHEDATCFNYKTIDSDGVPAGVCAIRGCASVEENVYGPYSEDKPDHGQIYDIFVREDRPGIPGLMTVIRPCIFVPQMPIVLFANLFDNILMQ